MEVVGVDRTWRKLPHGGGERLAADPLDAPTTHAVAEVLQFGPDVRGVIHDGSLRGSHAERERHQPCDRAFPASGWATVPNARAEVARDSRISGRRTAVLVPRLEGQWGRASRRPRPVRPRASARG